jgi:alkylation response protein AidB-like acyl-CoA dehydrogenase
MDFDLTSEQAALQSRARAFAADTIAPAAGHIDATDQFPRDVIAGAGRARIIVASGAGAVTRAALVAEALAGPSAAVALAISVNALVAQAIAAFGHATYADRVGQLEAGISVGALALSAPPIDATDRSQPATIDGGVLTGAKPWIANGLHADVALIVARRELEHVTTLVDLKDGVGRTSVGETSGARGLACATLTFANVRVASEAFLRGRDGVPASGWLVAAGRAINAAVAIGVGRAALDEALAASRARNTQVPQSVQFMLADMSTELDAAWLLTLKAAGAVDEGRVAAEASMAGVQAVDAARRATDAAVTIIGPAAVTRGARPERLMRDARAIQWFMGTPDAQRSTVAEAILQ